MVAVAAVLATVAGLQRRSERFRAVATEQVAASRIGYFNNPTRTQDNESSYYHVERALTNLAAADRPWFPMAPDPPEPSAVRAFRLAHEAVKPAYPGIDLAEYNLQVTTMDQGGPFPLVRYRHQDGKSGLNVSVRDPIQIHVHADGPPPAPRPALQRRSKAEKAPDGPADRPPVDARSKGEARRGARGAPVPSEESP